MDKSTDVYLTNLESCPAFQLFLAFLTKGGPKQRALYDWYLYFSQLCPVL